MPPRNTQFIGRDFEISALAAGLQQSVSGDRGGLSSLEVVGMGGVGKTQLASKWHMSLQGPFSYLYHPYTGIHIY